MDEVRIFQNKMPETIIFKFTKTRFSEKKSTILNLKNRNALLSNIYSKAKLSLEKQKENDLFMYHKKILDSNSNSIWSTYPDINLKEYSKLDDVACVAVGMVSGFDKAFRIDQENIEEFTDEQVDKIIFPFVKGKHCMGFYVEGHSNYILLDDQVKNETDFQEKYPSVYKKFLSYKKSMGNRYLPSNKKWYQWQALRNYETFKEAIEAPKIFVPTLDRSKTNRFSLSTKRVYPSGDVLTIIPQKIDPFFLLGYLNSSFFRRYYLANGARRGRRLVYTQRLVSNAKIPLFPNEIKEKISALAEIIFNTTDQSLRNEIDELIASYFARKKE